RAALSLHLPRRAWEDEPHALLRPSVLVLLDPPADLPLWPAPVTTDTQGRFALRGLGAGLGLGLQVQDERFALQVLDLPPRGAGEAAESRPVRAPAGIREGTITDSETGKPLPRARLRADWRCASCHDSPFPGAEALLCCGAGGGADWKGRRGAGDGWASLRL